MKNYWDAMRMLAAPMGTIVGVLAVVFYFAAESWVKDIARAEFKAQVELSSAQATTLTEHTGLLAQHDEEIEDNEDEIEKVDDKFTDFVRDIIAKF